MYNEYSSKYYDYTYNPNRYNEYRSFDNLGSKYANQQLRAYRSYEKNKAYEQELNDLYRYKKEPKEGRGVLDRVFDTLSIGQYMVAGASKGAGDGYEENGLLGGFTGAIKGTLQGAYAGNPFGKGNKEWEYGFDDFMNSGAQKLNPLIAPHYIGGKIANAITGRDDKVIGERDYWDSLDPQTGAGKFAKGAVGFIGNVAIDPTTYIGGAVVKPFIKGTGTKIASKTGIKTVEEITETTVREMIQKSMGGVDDVADDVVKRYTKKLNKSRGIVPSGTENVTWFGKTLVKGDTLRSIGDHSFAPYYNALTSGIRGSNFGKLFNNSYKLRKLALENPDEVLKYLGWDDSRKLIAQSKLLKDDEVKEYVSSLTEKYSEETRNKISHIIENPKSYKTFTKWEEIADDTELVKALDEIIKPQLDEINALEKMVKNEVTGLTGLKNVLKQEGDVLENLFSTNNNRVKKILKEIIDPDGNYSTFTEAIENLHEDDAYKYFADIRMGKGDFLDDLIDYDVLPVKQVDEVMDGQLTLDDGIQNRYDYRNEQVDKMIENPRQLDLFGESKPYDLEVNYEVPVKNEIEEIHPGQHNFFQWSDKLNEKTDELIPLDPKKMPKMYKQNKGQTSNEITQAIKLYRKQFEIHKQAKNKIGYIPVHNQNRVDEIVKFFDGNPQLLRSLQGKKADVKATWINKVMFNGNEIVKSHASNTTLNKIIKAISVGNVKSANNLMFSVTQQGMDSYKYLMGKYGTEMLELPKSHTKLNFNIDDLRYMLEDGEVDIDALFKGNGKTGVQVYKTVGQLEEVIKPYQKQLNDLNYKKLQFDYSKYVKELDEQIKVTKNPVERERLFTRKKSVEDNLKQLKKEYYGNANRKGIIDDATWTDADEKLLQQVQDDFDRVSKPFLNRKRELDFIKQLDKNQLEFYMEHYSKIPFDQISTDELSEILDLSGKTKSDIFNAHALDAHEVAPKFKANDDYDKLIGDEYEQAQRALNEATEKTYLEKQKEYPGFTDSDYEVETTLKPLRDKVETVGGKKIIRKGVFGRNGEEYIKNLENALYNSKGYSTIPFEERKAIVEQYSKIIKNIDAWLNGKKTPYSKIATPEEIFDLIKDDKVVVIKLTDEQLDKTFAPLSKGGKVALSQGIPFVPVTNHIDRLKSVIALGTGKSLEIQDMTGKKITTNIGYSFETQRIKRKAKDGSDYFDYVKTKVLDENTGKPILEPQSTIYFSKKNRDEFNARIVAEKKLQKTVQEVVKPVTKQIDKVVDDAPKKVNFQPLKTLDEVTEQMKGINTAHDLIKRSIQPLDDFTDGRYVLDETTGEYIEKFSNEPYKFTEVYEGEQLQFNDLSKDIQAKNEAKSKEFLNSVENKKLELEKKVEDIGKQLQRVHDAEVTDETLTSLLNIKLAENPQLLEGISKGGKVEVKDGIAWLKKVGKQLDKDQDTPQDVVDVIYDMIAKFKKMGKDEYALSKLSNFVESYVPHIVNPKALRDPKVLKGLKEYDEKLYEKILKYKNKEGVINPFSYSRKINGTIAEINEQMRKSFKVAGVKFDEDFFIQDIGEIYLARALKHNELIYDGEFVDQTLKYFGERVDLFDGFKSGNKVYIGQPDLRKSMQSLPEIVQKEVFEKLNFDLEKGSVKPIIEVSREKAQEVFKILQKHGQETVPFNAYNMPDIVMDKVKQIGKLQETKDLNAFGAVYDKFLKLWKMNVTVTMPGFHVRNFTSNYFQNFLNVGGKIFDPGFNKRAYGVINGADGVITSANGQEYTYKQIRELAQIHGVVSHNQFGSDLGERIRGEGGILNYIRGDRSPKLPSKLSSINPFDTENFALYRAGMWAGNKVESAGRMQNFIANIELGLSPEEAVEMTDKFLFDYSDLTEFEQQFMKRAIPFYTWIKKNASLQWEQVLTNPGRYSFVAKGYNATGGFMADEDKAERRFLPEFMQDWVQLPFEVKNPDGEDEIVMFNPNMPYSGLTDAIPSFKNIWGKTTPFVKTPVELGLGYNMYFESPIYNKKDGVDINDAKRIADYLLEQNGTANALYDLYDKEGLDKILHMLNNGAGMKFSTYNYDKYTEHKNPK